MFFTPVWKQKYDEKILQITYSDTLSTKIEEQNLFNSQTP
jgi:hypothetical protein